MLCCPEPRLWTSLSPNCQHSTCHWLHVASDMNKVMCTALCRVKFVPNANMSKLDTRSAVLHTTCSNTYQCQHVCVAVTGVRACVLVLHLLRPHHQRSCEGCGYVALLLPPSCCTMPYSTLAPGSSAGVVEPESSTHGYN